MFAESLKHMFRDGSLTLPFQSMTDQMLPCESAASLLECAVLLGMIRGWETAEVGGFGEGDWIGGVFSHCLSNYKIRKVIQMVRRCGRAV